MHPITGSFLEHGFRIAQIVEPGSAFDVAPPLFWAEAELDEEPHMWYYLDGEAVKFEPATESPPDDPNQLLEEEFEQHDAE